MGEWKAPLSLRVCNQLRAELEGIAARERRTLGNAGATLVEWATAQFRVAGTIDRLLKVELRKARDSMRKHSTPTVDREP